MGGGILLGLLVLAVAGRADEAAAVKAVEKLGGRITVDAKRPGKPVVGVKFVSNEVTDPDPDAPGASGTQLASTQATTPRASAA